MAERIGVFFSGLFILACFSYLFKPTKFYTYTEHLYVGFGAAQAIVLGFDSVKKSAINPIGKGDLWALVPVVMGAMLYAKYKKSWSYIARIPMAFMMGVAAGLTVTGVVEAQFIKQIRATILPLNSINNVILVLGTTSTIAFFLFIPLGKKDRGYGNSNSTLGKIAGSMGRATIMVALGSSYGFTVMARLSYLIARLQFLLGKWIPVLPQ